MLFIFFNFSDSFFDNQLNLMTENRFDPLSKDNNVRLSSNSSKVTNFSNTTLGGLKLISININSIRGKKLDLLVFLEVHQPHVVAIQETKIDSSIATSELFPEIGQYNVFRKDRNLHGGGVMLLIYEDIPHTPLTELVNDSELVWANIFANKTSHYIASWYRQPGGSCEEFQLFWEQLNCIRTKHKGNKLPSVHVLRDFNFKDVAWPDRTNKSRSLLNQSEGQMLIDVMNDRGFELLVHFSTRKKNTSDLIPTSLPGQFQEIYSPDKLSDHDVISGTLKIHIIPQPPPPPSPHQKKKKRNLGERCFCTKREISNQ